MKIARIKFSEKDIKEVDFTHLSQSLYDGSINLYNNHNSVFSFDNIVAVIPAGTLFIINDKDNSKTHQ